MILRPFFCLILAGSTLAQYQIQLNPERDNTLYFDEQGSVSNGQGELLFAGISGIGQPRATVLRFDLGGLPDGAIVTDVQLRLVVSKIAPFAKEGTLGVHRLMYDWGEGASNAVVDPGKGAPAEDQDATWLHRFYPAQFWVRPGGDFDPLPSAEARTGMTTGPILWSSTRLKDDVQAWVDGTRPNAGWLIQASAPLPKWTARGFDSRESVTPEARPRLDGEHGRGGA